MQLWQMDVMGGVLLDDDTELKVVTGWTITAGFCVAAGLVTRATSKAVCAVLSQALSRYGIPDEILTDNGKVFTGRFGPSPSRCCSIGSAERTGSASRGCGGVSARHRVVRMGRSRPRRLGRRGQARLPLASARARYVQVQLE
jgi:hypothetical protein